MSGDAGRVAIAGRDFAATEPYVSTLAVADLATGDRLMGPIVFDVPFSSISINHDGSMVAVIDDTGALRLIAADGGATRLVSGTATHPRERDSDKAGSMRFAEDGQQLYYGNIEGQLLVIDPRSAEVIETIAMPPESANVSMTVLSTGEVITTGDRRIALVDIAAGLTRWVQQFVTSPEEPCPWVAASVAVGTVYCGDHFGHIAERSLETGAPTERTFEPQLDLVGPLAVTSEGRELVAVGRGEPAVTRWMLDGSGAATRVQAPGWSMLDRYDLNGSRLLIARGTGPPQTWDGFDEFAVLDTRSGELVIRLPVPSYNVTWAGAGVLVGEIGGRGEGHTAFVEVESGKTYQGDGLPPGTLARTISPDGGRMFLTMADGELLAADPTTGRLLDWRIRVVGTPRFMTSSADSTELLVTTWSETGPRTAVFDAASGKRLRTAPEGISWPVYTARDEIIGSTFNRISRFDAEDFDPLGAIPGVPGGIFTLSVSPDGRTLSVYTLGDTLSMYDLIEGIRLGDPIQVSSVGNVVLDPYALPRYGPSPECSVPMAPSSPRTSLPASHCGTSDRRCRQRRPAVWQDVTSPKTSGRPTSQILGPYRSTCGFGSAGAKPAGEGAGRQRPSMRGCATPYSKSIFANSTEPTFAPPRIGSPWITSGVPRPASAQASTIRSAAARLALVTARSCSSVVVSVTTPIANSASMRSIVRPSPQSTSRTTAPGSSRQTAPGPTASTVAAASAANCARPSSRLGAGASLRGSSPGYPVPGSTTGGGGGSTTGSCARPAASDHADCTTTPSMTATSDAASRPNPAHVSAAAVRVRNGPTGTTSAASPSIPATRAAR